MDSQAIKIAKQQAERINKLKPNERKFLRLENDWIGFLEAESGQEEFVFLKKAVNALLGLIENRPDLLEKFPKSNWSVGYRGDDDKWVSVFKISSATIRKLQKENLFP